MDKISRLPNYSTYLVELITAAAKNDQKTINEIFSKIDVELKENRNKMSMRFERNKITWNDPEDHFREVQREECVDLRLEFVDNQELFTLASKIPYKPIMAVTFARMIQNLNDIRQRTNIRIERNKIMWNDPEDHFRGVQTEKRGDLISEISDLKDLYIIAKAGHYLEGEELIIDRLNKIAPNVLNSLTNGTTRK